MAKQIAQYDSFKGGHAEAKKLLHAALTRAVQNPDDDRPLDQVFNDPEGAAALLGADSKVELSLEDAEALRRLGGVSFTQRLTEAGGPQAVKALVDCLERMDMPEVSV